MKWQTLIEVICSVFVLVTHYLLLSSRISLFTDQYFKLLCPQMVKE